MKRFFPIFLILFFASKGFGATFYISKTGSNTAPYDTWAKAATQIKTVIDYIRTNAPTPPNTIYIAAGTYNSTNDYFYLDNANLSNLIIIGAGKDNTIIQPCASYYTIFGTTANNVAFKDISLIAYTDKNALYKADGCDNWNFENVAFVSPPNHSVRLITINGDKTDFIRCVFKFRQNSGSNIIAQFYNDSNGNINYCIFIPIGSSSFNGGILFWNFTGTYTLNNCIILTSIVYGVCIAGTSTGIVNINNSIISNLANSSDSYPIQKLSGTINVKNSLIVAGPKAPLTPWNAVALDENNIKNNSDPKFRTYKRMGFIIPRVDDSGNYSYVKSLESLFNTYGTRGTFFVQTYNLSSYLSYFRSILQNGIFEIGSHSYSHSDLTNTQAYSITKSGATINIDRANDQIVINPGGIVSNFKSKTLNQIKTELEALGCSIGSFPTNLSGNTLGESLSDSGGAQPSPYTPSLLIDTTGQTGFFKVEIKDSKEQLENASGSGLGDLIDPQTGIYFQVKSFAHPYSGYNNDTIATIRNTNYKSSSLINMSKSAMPDLDLYRIYIYSAHTYLKDSTEALVRQRARALGFAVKQGAIVQVLAHNASELTVQQWEWCIDEWIKMGIPASHITSMQLVVKYIEESGLWTNEGTGIWTKTYEEDDYHLQSISPCIDAGVNVGLTEDFDGRNVPTGSTPDIGAYELNGPIALYVFQNNLPNSNINEVLIQNGFGIKHTSIIPNDLTNYSILILNLNDTCDQKYIESIKNFIQSGGGVLIIGKTPKFLSGNNEDLSSIQEWFGAGWYGTDCGYATIVINHPFGTDLLINDKVDYSQVENCISPSINNPNQETIIISKWNTQNGIHSFIHSFGKGRVFYYSGEPGYCDDPGESPQEILENGLYLFETGLIWVSKVNYCKGDFDSDGDVDGSDLAIFAGNFGRTDCNSESPCIGDFDGDGDVDLSDLAIFATYYGRIN